MTTPNEDTGRDEADVLDAPEQMFVDAADGEPTGALMPEELPRPERRGMWARPGTTKDPGVASEMRTLRDRQSGQLRGKAPAQGAAAVAKKVKAARNKIMREAEAAGVLPDLAALPRTEGRPQPLPIPLSDDVEPWERQPREAGRAYACFVVFRDLGPFERSIRRVAKDLGVGRTVPQRMSVQWRWDERAAAWDARKQAEFDATRKEEQEKAVRSHANATRALLGQAVRLLQNQQGKVVPEGRVLRDVALTMDKAIYHQRLALGLPTEMSRQDIFLKGVIAEMERNHTEILTILEEVLCDDCRDATRARILAIKRREQVAMKQVS